MIGITPSQSARNTLAAGVPVSYNTAQFLGHLPGRRGARGPVRIGPGTLLVIDEASMISGPDLADLIAYAESRGAKVILAGDTASCRRSRTAAACPCSPTRSATSGSPSRSGSAAPGNRPPACGCATATPPCWPSMTSTARIIGGDPEQMMDAAAAAYVALTAGRHRHAADGRRPRAAPGTVPPHPRRPDHLGHRLGGPAVTIADGARASPGDLIVCTRNDHSVEAGEPGRTLANGDLLRIEAVTRRGLLVRRALDADPRTGQRRWTDRHFLYDSHEDAELGYAVTDHAAQGRTVHTGLAVITGTEDRQHAYVALTRGTDVNLAYVFTAVPQDRRPGPRPAPGPRTGPLRPPRRPDPAARPGPQRRGQALGVLAEVLDRDGQQLSATQTRHQALADADHLAILHAIWAAETTPAREQRYQDLLTTRCRPATGTNPATRPNGCGGPCAPPNWPAWTPRRSWPPRSANGTWPDPATSPPSSTPASAAAPAPWSRSRPGPGPRSSPPSPTPNAARTSPRSPR